MNSFKVKTMLISMEYYKAMNKKNTATHNNVEELFFLVLKTDILLSEAAGR